MPWPLNILPIVGFRKLVAFNVSRYHLILKGAVSIFQWMNFVYIVYFLLSYNAEPFSIKIIGQVQVNISRCVRNEPFVSFYWWMSGAMTWLVKSERLNFNPVELYGFYSLVMFWPAICLYSRFSWPSNLLWLPLKSVTHFGWLKLSV